jgi:hypothetical protein
MKHVEILSAIQADLNAPKGQTNKFGGYTYRSCEDILEALKPLLAEHRAAVTLTDELVNTEAGHIYIKAKATLLTTDGEICCEALAREPMDAKGMSPAQCTGAASSYARKYALNGLFSIDDNKDADATNTHGKEEKPDRDYPDSIQNDTKKPRFAKSSSESPKVTADTTGANWKEYAVPFGKNIGVKLGDLKEASLFWYVDNIEDKHAEFRGMLDVAAKDKESGKKAAETEATTPDAVEELPFEDTDELPF